MIPDFHCPKLQKAFDKAKLISRDKLHFLDMISDDIRKLEKFLQSSGFPPYHTMYGDDSSIYLKWDGFRLNLNDRPLIEAKATERVKVHPLLGNFLTQISENQ